MPYVQFDLRRALRAARILVADPDDLPQVFTIIESLSGNTFQRITDRLRTTPSGQRLTAARPDIVNTLGDRTALQRLPEGSLGRAYLAFVERENISAYGIREAGEKGSTRARRMPESVAWVYSRMRDTHDLWHAAVGYSGDVLGETALLAFSFAQTGNPAIALIIAIGFAKMGGVPGARSTILDGYRRGCRAEWLPQQEWESLLALPVAEVRRRLRLEAPPRYVPLRSADVRAAQAT